MRDREDRSRNDNRRDTGRSSKKSDFTPVAFSNDPTSFTGGGLKNNVNAEVLSAWFAPWFFGPASDPMKNRVMALHIEYQNMDDEEDVFIEHAHLGSKSLQFFAPFDAEENDYAGGYGADDYRDLLQDPTGFDEDKMRGEWFSSTDKVKGPEIKNSNYHYYLQCFETLYKAENNGERYDWSQGNGSINALLKGWQFRLGRLKNNLMSDEFAQEVLVPVEIHGRAKAKSGSKTKASSSASSTSSRDRGRGRQEEEEEEEPKSRRTRDEKPEQRRGSSRKSNALDPDTVSLFTDAVVGRLKKAKNGELSRSKFASLIGDFDDADDGDKFVEVVEDSAYDNFWADADDWNYDEESRMVTLV